MPQRLLRLSGTVLAAALALHGCRGEEEETASSGEGAGEPAESPEVESGGAATSSSDAEAAKPLPDGAQPLVDELRSALQGIADCPKRPDSIRAEDREACLEPVRSAGSELLDPADELAPSEEARRQLERAAVEVVREALAHEDPSVRLHTLVYAVNERELDPAGDEAARRELEDLVDSGYDPIAEWAVRARLQGRGPRSEESVEFAWRVLREHGNEQARVAACRYLGGRGFRDQREHFERLLKVARDEGDHPVVRSCAVTRLGVLGGEEDVETIAGFLSERPIRHAALFALQRGIGTPKARKRVVSWFEANAEKPGVANRGNLRFLVPDQPSEGFPVERAGSVLDAIARSDQVDPTARRAAVEELARLGATDELEALDEELGDEGADARVRPALREALEQGDNPEAATADGR